MQLISTNLNLSDVLIKLAKIDPLLEPINPISSVHTRAQESQDTSEGRVKTYNSSISPGVRRAISGRINQDITTAMKPVPAKLYHRQNHVSLIL